MKKIFIVFIAAFCFSNNANADGVCKTNQYQKNYNHIKIIYGTSCGSDYRSVGTTDSFIQSCETLSSDDTSACFMYVGPGTSFKDTTGTYEYTDICTYSE